MLRVHDRCLQLLASGVPYSSLEEIDLSAVTARAKDVAGPDDAAAVRAVGDRMRRGCSRACDEQGADRVHRRIVATGPAGSWSSGVDGVGWDEVAEIRLPSGEHRHGVVIDVSRDLAVVQIYEGTAGMAPGSVRVAFQGSPMRIPVGEDWLGRVCNGRGEPLDGGPPVFGGAAGRRVRPADQPHRAGHADASRS